MNDFQVLLHTLSRLSRVFVGMHIRHCHVFAAYAEL